MAGGNMDGERWGDEARLLRGDAARLLKGDAARLLKGDAARLLKGDVARLLVGELVLVCDAVMLSTPVYKPTEAPCPPRVLEKELDLAKGEADDDDLPLPEKLGT